MDFVTAYGPKNKVSLGEFPKTMTKQAMKQECDINFIIDKFQRTGVIEHQKTYQGQYGEFDNIDFHEAMNTVAVAQEMFASVPSSIRKRFGNDPGAFVEFVNDPGNIPEMRKMGLLNPLEAGPAEPKAAGHTADPVAETPPA